MFSLSFWSIMAKMAVRNSPASLEVSMPCSSKHTPTLRALSSRTDSRHSLAFRANREQDFTRILSTRPRRQSARSLWKSSRFSVEVPVMPLSAYTSTNSHSGLAVMISVWWAFWAAKELSWSSELELTRA